MGLNGRLDDLPLLDLLQIIAFSKKSGYLRVSGAPGRGAVLLKEGRVLFSYSWSTVSRVRELAAEPSRITPETLRECIEASLRDLGSLREGSFQFDLGGSMTEDWGELRIKPLLLEQGLDPQELLLDLAVELDFERREAAAEKPDPVTAPSENATLTDYVATMTRKLFEPRGTRDVSGLVLDVAGKFIERGMLFVIKGKVAKGIAGYGFARDSRTCSVIAQRIVIDVEASSPVEEVVKTGKTVPVAKLEGLAEPVYSVVERARAGEAVFLPLLYNGATLLFLFGDNGKTGAPLGDLSRLESFLAQAGMALENQYRRQTLGPRAPHAE